MLAAAGIGITTQLASSSSQPAKGPSPSSACCISPSPITPSVLATQQNNDDAFFAKRAAWITAYTKTSFNPATLQQGEIRGLREYRDHQRLAKRSGRQTR